MTGGVVEDEAGRDLVLRTSQGTLSILLILRVTCFRLSGVGWRQYGHSGVNRDIYYQKN